MKYWNGFQWRENDASSSATARINGPVGPQVTVEELLEAELNPPDKTGDGFSWRTHEQKPLSLELIEEACVVTLGERSALLEAELNPPDETGEFEAELNPPDETGEYELVEKLSGATLKLIEDGELDDSVDVIAAEATSLAGAIDWTYEEEMKDV